MTRLVVLLSLVSSFGLAEPLAVHTGDGLTIAAQTWGNPAGREIVFIHGLGQSHLSWKRQYEGPLADQFRIVTYDLRGHGDSDKPTDEAAYTDGKRWGDDLAAVIEAAHLKHPVLVGWSLGGVVIEKYLEQGRHVAGVVLVDAVVAFKPELFTKAHATLIGPLSSDDLDVRSRGIADFLRACFVRTPAQADLDQMLVYNGMVAPQLGRALAHKGISLARGDGTWRRLEAPTWILFGAKDTLVGRVMAEYAHHLIAGSKLTIYPDAGHAAFYDEPLRFAAELAAFVTATP